jgi:hypothetical protein
MVKAVVVRKFSQRLYRARSCSAVCCAAGIRRRCSPRSGPTRATRRSRPPRSASTTSSTTPRTTRRSYELCRRAWRAHGCLCVWSHCHPSSETSRDSVVKFGLLDGYLTEAMQMRLFLLSGARRVRGDRPRSHACLPHRPENSESRSGTASELGRPATGRQGPPVDALHGDGRLQRRRGPGDRPRRGRIRLR